MAGKVNPRFQEALDFAAHAHDAKRHGRKEHTIVQLERERDPDVLADRGEQARQRPRERDELAEAITRIVERMTTGFGHLGAAGRPDLMVDRAQHGDSE